MLEIITPEKTVYQSEAASLVVPSCEGRMGILAGHMAGVAALEPGVVEVRDSEGETHVFITTGGYAEIMRNRVNLLVESAEKPGQADLQASRLLVDEAEKVIRDSSSTPEQIFQAKHTMERELGRIKAIGKIKF